MFAFINKLLFKYGLRKQVTVHSETYMITLNSLDGKCLGVCKNYEKFLGYTYEDLLSKSPYDYIHPDDIETVLSSHLETKNGTPKVFSRFKKKSGGYVWLETHSTVIGDRILTFSKRV